MTEAKKPAAKEAKAKAPAKKPAAKAEPKKAEPKAAPKAEKKPAAAPKAASGKTIRVVQTGSRIGRQSVQEKTLIGLGLNKRHRERVLEDTPAVRGMIEKVKHLVKVVG